MSTASFRTARTATLWRGCSTYFRRAETSGKYVIYSESDAGGWRIGRLNHRGDEPRIDLDTETVYASSALAQQAVLEARVKTLRDEAGEAGEADEAGEAGEAGEAARPAEGSRRGDMSDEGTPALYGYASGSASLRARRSRSTSAVRTCASTRRSS